MINTPRGRYSPMLICEDPHKYSDYINQYRTVITTSSAHPSNCDQATATSEEEPVGGDHQASQAAPSSQAKITSVSQWWPRNTRLRPMANAQIMAAITAAARAHRVRSRRTNK